MAAPEKKKSYRTMIILGTLSIIGYMEIFTHQQFITDISTGGGMYASLPIIAAFLFSFIHGGFASEVLSALGIEAAKKKK
jgi:hypothetical protein